MRADDKSPMPIAYEQNNRTTGRSKTELKFEDEIRKVENKSAESTTIHTAAYSLGTKTAKG